MNKKKVKKVKKAKLKKGYTICPDCQGEYKIGAPHYAFCEAKTCSFCGTTGSDVLELNDDGYRICLECEESEPSDEPLEYEDEDSYEDRLNQEDEDEN